MSKIDVKKSFLYNITSQVFSLILYSVHNLKNDMRIFIIISDST